MIRSSLIKFNSLCVRTLACIPYFRFLVETQGTQTPIDFKTWFIQKVLGFNRRAYWPVHFTSSVNVPGNIYAGIETCPGYMPGCYIQGIGKIYIGDYTQIASNVGIVSCNHDFYDSRLHLEPKAVRIGKYCWIGMNSVILPGVNLGNFTIVGAGSIVTKSFPDGFCVIAGNPAKLIRSLDRSKCVEFHSAFEYNGYIPASKFEAYRKSALDV